MQIILTEKAYAELQARANSHKCVRELSKQLKELQSNYKELEAKYNKLLVFGVSTSNERLKNSYSKQED